MRFSFLLRAAASAVFVVALQSPAHAQDYKITGVSAITAGGEIPLESLIGVSQHTMPSALTGFGINHTRDLIEVPGDRSGVRLRAADVQGFLVHAQNEWVEHQVFASSLDLRLLVIKKGKARQFVTDDSTGVLVTMTKKDSSPKLAVTVSQYDDHTAKIVPKVLPLLSGEYGFESIMSSVPDDPQTGRYEKTKKVTVKDLGHYRMYCFAIE